MQRADASKLGQGSMSYRKNSFYMVRYLIFTRFCAFSSIMAVYWGTVDLGFQWHCRLYCLFGRGWVAGGSRERHIGTLSYNLADRSEAAAGRRSHCQAYESVALRRPVAHAVHTSVYSSRDIYKGSITIPLPYVLLQKMFNDFLSFLIVL